MERGMALKTLGAVLAAAILMLSLDVHAESAGPANAAAATPAVEEADDERMVCTYEKTIGSNMKKRICKTVAQRNKEREESRDMMNRSRSVCSEIGCGNK